MIAIRPATADDFRAIRNLSGHLGYSRTPIDKARTKLLKILESPTDFVYVAEYDHTVAGWIHLFSALRLASEDFVEIGGLVVAPESRGYGIGKALVRHASCEHPGKLRVRCNEQRSDTHKFYTAIGFERNKVQYVFEA